MSEEEINEENDEESSTTRKSSQRILNKPKKITKNSKNTKISSTNSETLVNHWILYEKERSLLLKDDMDSNTSVFSDASMSELGDAFSQKKLLREKAKESTKTYKMLKFKK
jgi:TFIIF-interacting CTD phosphatase-like protein